eukprot:gene7888-8740_t
MYPDLTSTSTGRQEPKNSRMLTKAPGGALLGSKVCGLWASPIINNPVPFTSSRTTWELDRTNRARFPQQGDTKPADDFNREEDHETPSTADSCFVDNTDDEVDSEGDFDVEEPDKGLMETLMEHINQNANNVKQDINSQVDALIQTLNERREELLLQVDHEREQKLNRLRNRRRRCARSYCKGVEMLQGQPGRRRFSEDLSVETARDARTVENLRSLQCGDLKISFDEQIYDHLKQFGRVEDSLASGLHSEAIGLGLFYSFMEEKAIFQVITKNNTMNKTFTDDDKIQIKIEGPNEQAVTAMINTKNNGVHTVSYKPTSIGHHRIHVYVNQFELLESPFVCETFSKEDLAFERRVEFLSASLNQTDDWVLNKEETSALLETNNQSGAMIFGAKSFTTGKHGWRVKFTSACAGVKIAIGVSFKTRIVEIDTRYTRHFKMNPVTTMPYGRNTRSHRKLSTFHRQTRLFYVILNMDECLLTVVCCEREEHYDITIPKHANNLYPCVYMVHECANGVCPRPVVAFS